MPSSTFHEPLAYSIKDACHATSLGRTRLYELINGGEIEVIKIGRRTLVTAASLRRLIKQEA